MDWNNPRSVESLIKRLTREIADIDKLFYHSQEIEDRVAYTSMLDHKRDDIVRGTVIQMHTAIEDLLDTMIICSVLNVKPEERRTKFNSNYGNALLDLLKGERSIGFSSKLLLAVALRLISKAVRDKLITLNTLRNKCSHNWLLKSTVRLNIRRKKKKKALLNYQGRDLHRVEVLKDFYGEYGDIYVRLYQKCYL